VGSKVSVLLSNTPDVAAVLDLAKLAEDTGLSRAWLAETGGLDAAGLGAVIADRTSLEIGTAIVPVYSRTPALLAMMAGTWARFGGGDRPVHLGIGAGGQVIVERWHGVPFDRPLDAVRDTLRVLRQAFAAERTSYRGPARHSDGFRLALGPVPSAKVYVGGMGPKMQRLGAEEADGLIVTWLSPRVLSAFAADFTGTVRAAGRSRGEVTLVARAYVAVTGDVDACREAVRRELVEYLVSPPYARYFRSVGFGAEVDAVSAGFAARDRERAVAGVSDRLLDEVLVVGRSAGDVTDRLAAYLAAGADDLMVQPVPEARGGDPRRTVAALAAVGG
jgi:probable F420-dependent oxidoreductase